MTPESRRFDGFITSEKKRMKTFHRGGDIWHQQFVMCSPIPWNTVVPPESTTLVSKRRKLRKNGVQRKKSTHARCRFVDGVKHFSHNGTECVQNDSNSVDTSRDCISHQCGSVYHAKTSSSVSQRKKHPWFGGTRGTSHCGCQRHTSWNSHVSWTRLHNSDDVSVWELTSLLFAGRSELCVVVLPIQHNFNVHQNCPPTRSQHSTATRRRHHIAHLSTRNGACTTRLVSGWHPREGAPKCHTSSATRTASKIILEKGDSGVRETQDDLVRMELGNCCQLVGFHEPVISERNFSCGRDCAADGDPSKLGTIFPWTMSPVIGIFMEHDYAKHVILLTIDIE